ncbi:MAG: flagellar motor protein MotB [Acidimicrobiales bacterium]|jgi:chemotaxis protein MotB
MSRPKKHGEEENEEGASAERWLLTYADMITLLMVLFIVLFAMGQTDIRKFNAFKDSFHELSQQSQANAPPGGPGILSQPSAIALLEQNPYAKLDSSSATSAGGKQENGEDSSGQQANGQSQAGQDPNNLPSQTVSAGQSAKGAAAEKLALSKALLAMEKALDKAGLENEVQFTFDQRGLVVTILTNQILFPLDSAQLQPEGVKIINAIAPVLAALPNQIDVEGDTDNQAITGGPYASNWALSAARAVAVVQSLISDDGIDPARLEATGNSDTRPVVPNNSAQHRAENRRVEIVIFSTTVVTP